MKKSTQQSYKEEVPASAVDCLCGGSREDLCLVYTPWYSDIAFIGCKACEMRGRKGLLPERAARKWNEDVAHDREMAERLNALEEIQR